MAAAEEPSSALRRAAPSAEPSVTITGNALVNAAAPNFGANVSANGQTVTKVQFLLIANNSFFFRPSGAVDYLLAEDASAPYQANTSIWSAWSEVRARVFYANGARSVDSAPLPFIFNSAASVSPFTSSPLEVHNYPTGAIGKDGTYTLIGDGFNFLQRAANGDCTLVARLASITPDQASSDGVHPGSKWHPASFDNVNLLAAGLSGASTVAVSPAVNSVVRGQAVTLAARVVDSAPGSIRWQRNGVDMPGAATPIPSRT